MSEKKIIAISRELIQKDFGLEEKIILDDENNEEQLISHLIKVVKYLLDHDFERLLNIMYRIDLPENRVKNVLSTSSPQNLDRELSVMILDREKSKATTRIQYSK
ncbi:hypothetical protein [Marinoscillum pacificum]|uniref:hypothetical protein n=1 Tax=Marinoscillum pacificum TaxID=392723 RepID=UPI0021571F9D|nr:hypothetical protein [Marinoscillum pacificum]